MTAPIIKYIQEIYLISIRFTMCGTETSFDTNTFRDVGETSFDTNTFRNVGETLQTPHLWGLLFSQRRFMQEHGIYFATKEFYQLIRNLGGQWDDTKTRPIICLLKSKESPQLYWAIPMGNWNHRNQSAKSRITSYLNLDSSNIQSCFYHVGKSNITSIFFISDVIPITDKYIKQEYLNKYNQKIYIIKHPNYFRQHITTLKNYLLNELKENNV